MSAFQPCLFPNILRELRDECIIDQDNNETRKETTSIPVPFINEKEDILALDVVKLKKHLLERLLEKTLEGKSLTSVLPEEALRVHKMLVPVFEFTTSGEPTIQTMEAFLKFCDATGKLSEGHQSLFLKILRTFHSKIEFAVWCLNQLFVGPTLTPKTVLDLCVELPRLNALKALRGLQLVNEKEIQTLMTEDPQSYDVFKSYLVIVEFVHYLYKCFPRMKVNSSVEEVENLLQDIQPVEIQLQVMEDLFALCFLRREDIRFEESASEGGESEELLQQSATPSRSKCNSEQCASNSNSPNSQTGTSSATLAEKNGISLGFLCQQADKLQLSLEMLQRCIEHLDTAEDCQLSLRHRKLERCVKEGLWRLQLLKSSESGIDRYSGHNFSRGDGRVTVRKAWIARLPATIQSGYNYIPARRKPRGKAVANKSISTDPRLINRILSDPMSLMVMAMMNSNLAAARQVADLHQLWTSPQGRQLQFSLGHASACQELQRKMKTKRQEGKSSRQSSDVMENAILQGLNNVAVPSLVETLLSTLVQATQPFPEGSEDERVAVILADLLTCAASCSLAQDGWKLLELAWQRCRQMNMDVDTEPWKTLGRLVELAKECSAQMSGCAPLQSDSALRTPTIPDANLLQKQCVDLNRLADSYRQLEMSLKAEVWDKLEQDFGLVVDSLLAIGHTAARASDSNKHLLRLCNYIVILRQLAPGRLYNQSPTLLLSQDIGALVVERLREDHGAVTDLETPAARMGIQLPCFIARCLGPDQSTRGTSMDFSADADLISMLLTYVHAKCPLLARILDLQLRVERGIQVNFAADSDAGQDVDLSVLRRFLEHRKNGNASETVIFAPQELKRRPSAFNPPDRILETDNMLSPRSQSADERHVGHLILESVPAALVCQLHHLATQPLYMMEQMLMNGQMAAAADVIKLFRLHSTNPDAEELEIKDILLRYASKALVLGLPEIQAAGRRENDQHPPKRKRNAVFVIPATVPPKDQWVADAEVGQCPCCLSIQFSMFNRRHHCRRCGRVVCAGCSPHRQLVDGYGDVPMRTCNDCFRAMHGNATPIRAAQNDGKVLWMLSLDADHNEIVRREFSYEHAPNLALALAIVQLCREKDEIAHFLLNQSSAMLAALHRYLLGGALFEVDPTMILQLIKSLILTAKMRYSEIGIFTPNKGKPTRGLARCDALLGQIDLLSLLASANCLHLLPAQPLAQLDTWRKLRDRLIEIELWSLALDISTKAGLDAAAVWAAWGLVCLKAGNFQGARQRFQRCLKPGKTSPLLQEVVSVLESLCLPFCVSSSSNGPLVSKRNRKLSASQIVASDKPELILSSLARLKDICGGNFAAGDKDNTLDEILFYLTTYGSGEAPYIYLVERNHIDAAVHQLFNHVSALSTEVFNQGLLLPCLRTGRLDDLLFEMKRHDASLQTWKVHLLAAAHLLETKCFWNSLYQLYCLAGDHLRACLIAVRRLYLSDLFTIETLVARSELLEEILGHLRGYQFNPPPEPKEKEKQGRWPLWWPSHEVTSLHKSVQLQLDVTEFIDQCNREGRITAALLAVLKSVTQGSRDNNAASAGDLNHQIPSLLGSRSDRCACSVLVTVACPSSNGLQLSWKICNEQGVRLDRYFRLSAFVLIKQCQVPALILLVEFIRQRMTAASVGFFDVDELLVECATLVQDRDKEHKSQDTELIVQQIKKATIKIQAYINVGWLKAAYLLAVKNGLASDVINIQKEASRLQQSAVLTLCNRWLAARNAAK